MTTVSFILGEVEPQSKTREGFGKARSRQGLSETCFITLPSSSQRFTKSRIHEGQIEAKGYHRQNG